VAAGDIAQVAAFLKPVSDESEFRTHRWVVLEQEGEFSCGERVALIGAAGEYNGHITADECKLSTYFEPLNDQEIDNTGHL